MGFCGPSLCAGWRRSKKRADRRRCICGTRPIAERSTCASPATGPGTTTARRSDARRWCSFAGVLRKDPERFVLVTPVERVGVTVEDAPFLGVELSREGEGAAQVLRLRTNVEDWVEISPKNPLKFLPGESGGLKPYVLVRGDLWALVKRALFYDLVAWGGPRLVDGEEFFGVHSGGGFFPMAPMRDIAG